MKRVYIDTCIVSGIAKRDLAETESDALLKLLNMGKRGTLEVVTSEHTATEIARVPSEYRRPHEFILSLLANVPAVPTFRSDSGFLLLGVGGGSREDPLFSQLKSTVPDRDDAHHLFQASKNGAAYFLTVDRKTIISRSNAILAIANVEPVSPSRLLELLEEDQ